MATEKGKNSARAFDSTFADYVGLNIKEMAAKAGDPLYAEITPDAVKLYTEEMRLHFSSPDAWIEIGSEMLTEEMYSEFLKKRGMSEKEFAEIAGGISYVPEAKRKLIERFKQKNPELYYRRCADLFRRSVDISKRNAIKDTVVAFIDNGGEHVNLFAHSAKTFAERERMKYGSEGMSPNDLYYMRQLYTFKDVGYRQFYITSMSGQAQGTGKTNLVAVAAELAIKEYGLSDNFNLYVPSNFGDIGYKRMYRYNQLYETFINEPRGRSIANTVVEAKEREERTGLPSTFFSLLLAGEQGGGYTMSYDVQDLMHTLQIERHLRIQPIYSGVLEFPVMVMSKFVPYRIAMEVKYTTERDPDKIAENKAEFIAHIQHQISHPSQLIYKDEHIIRNVPKANTRLYAGTKGFGLDTTYISNFSIPQMLKDCKYEDDAFDKDPDRFIDAFSNYVLDLAESRGMNVDTWKKQKPGVKTAVSRKRIDYNIPENATMDDLEKAGLI
jgi:hypothetical protein